MLRCFIRSSVVTICLFGNSLPFIVTLVSVRYRREMRNYSIFGAWFPNVIGDFQRLVVTVRRRVLNDLFKTKRWRRQCTTGFYIPLNIASMFLTYGSFQASIRAQVISAMTLARLRGVRASTLLYFQVTFGNSVYLVPSVLPCVLIILRRFFPSLYLNFFALYRDVFCRFLPIVMR